LCCVPTITFGCAAAHEQKFHDGGLRKTFSGIVDIETRIEWLHFIQFNAGSIDLLYEKIKADPETAAIIFPFLYFGSKPQNDVQITSEKVKLQTKAFALAKRIDSVSCQALGIAATFIRTIYHLATIYGGKHFDTLAKSLKIGFLITAESFLSTQGDELGMIEDLDCAMLWLNKVGVRFVRSGYYDQFVEESHAIVESSEDAKSPTTYSPIRCEALSVERHANGQIFMNFEVSVEEEEVIIKAVKSLSRYSVSTVGIEREATEEKSTSSSNPFIIGEFKMVAMIFTQGQVLYTIAFYHIISHRNNPFFLGVNEMQTFANLSGSRDVLKQIEINKESLTRLREYFDIYKPLAKYQMELNYYESERLISEKKKVAAINSSFLPNAAETSNYMGSNISVVENPSPKSDLKPQDKMAFMSKRRYAANMSFLDRYYKLRILLYLQLNL
jgi:hypothetical protein